MCRIRSILMAGALLASPFPASVAMAATPTHVGLRHDLGRTVADTLPLTFSGKGLDEAVLDWRTPAKTFDIELAPYDWVETAELTLWADPIAPTDPDRRSGRDIRISVNGGEAQDVRLTRKGFSARIPLPLSDIRPGMNRVHVELVSAPGVSCLMESDGGWVIDLARSRMDTTARNRSRSVFLSEVRSFLERPTSQPLLLGIQAYGTDSLALEALIGQGLALRTAQAPRFTLTPSTRSTALTVVAGTRLALAGVISDKAVLDGKGPRIAVHEGRPLRLVLTGDTEDEVMASVKAFATRDLPDVRRRLATPTALDFAGPLDGNLPVLQRRASLDALGGFDFSKNWGAGADAIRFDASDAHGARGRLILDIDRADLIADDSYVDITLNERDLGRVSLAAISTQVELAIPQGWLRARGNTLEMYPVLNPVSDGCAPEMSGAGLRIRKASRIEILSHASPEAGDLARLASARSPLSRNGGKATTVQLPEARRDREHALRILGSLARGSGHALHASTYASQAPSDGNLLIVGASTAHLDVPRSLDLALSNRGRGHVVGLYPDEDRWVGIIAPDAASSLGSTANALTAEVVNNLSGGIARLQDGHVEVAHVAFGGGPLPVSERPIFDAQAFRLDATELGYSLEAELDSSVTLLSEAWSQLELPPLMQSAFRRVKPEHGLRGTFEAPKAVLPPITLADASGGLRAGFSLEELDIVMGRTARAMRTKLGLKPVGGTAKWTWGDRNLSFMAMLLMLAFALSVVGLFRAESRP